eukprot:comp23699_c0_seq1/m.40711 comp23699_c0_seq1/g.40711  ORF comp23699_c0_seq1/g.40711 comp23699_c0_seq1/m.40711 type:complete len:1174 (-) comp23699_c0_seq1:59-3580(-)
MDGAGWLASTQHLHVFVEEWAAAIRPVLVLPKGQDLTHWTKSCTDHINSEIKHFSTDPRCPDERSSIDFDRYVAHSLLFAAWVAHVCPDSFNTKLAPYLNLGNDGPGKLTTEAYIGLISALKWEDLLIQSLFTTSDNLFRLVLELSNHIAPQREEPLKGSSLVMKVVENFLPRAKTLPDGPSICKCLIGWVGRISCGDLDLNWWLVCVDSLAQLAGSLLADSPSASELQSEFMVPCLEFFTSGVPEEVGVDYDGYGRLERQARASALKSIEESTILKTKMVEKGWSRQETADVLGESVHLLLDLLTHPPGPEFLQASAYLPSIESLCAHMCSIDHWAADFPDLVLECERLEVVLRDHFQRQKEEYYDIPDSPSSKPPNQNDCLEEGEAMLPIKLRLWAVDDDVAREEGMVWFDWLVELVGERAEGWWEALDSLLAVPNDMQEYPNWAPPHNVPPNEWYLVWGGECDRAEDVLDLIRGLDGCLGQTHAYGLCVRLLWLLEWLHSLPLEKGNNAMPRVNAVYCQVRDLALSTYQCLLPPLRDVIKCYFYHSWTSDQPHGHHYNLFDAPSGATKGLLHRLTSVLNQIVASDDSHCQSKSKMGPSSQSNERAEDGPEEGGTLVLEAISLLAPYDVAWSYLAQAMQQKGNVGHTAAVLSRLIPLCPLSESRDTYMPPQAPKDAIPLADMMVTGQERLLLDVLESILYSSDAHDVTTGGFSNDLLTAHTVYDLVSALLGESRAVIGWASLSSRLVVPYLAWDTCSDDVTDLVPASAILEAVLDGLDALSQSQRGDIDATWPYWPLLSPQPIGLQILLLLCAVVQARNDLHSPLELCGGSLDGLLTSLGRWSNHLARAWSLLEDGDNEPMKEDLKVCTDWLESYVQAFDWEMRLRIFRILPSKFGNILNTPLRYLPQPAIDLLNGVLPKFHLQKSSSEEGMLAFYVEAWVCLLKAARVGPDVYERLLWAHTPSSLHTDTCRRGRLAAVATVLPDCTVNEWEHVARWLESTVCMGCHFGVIDKEHATTLGRQQTSIAAASALLTHCVVLFIAGSEDTTKLAHMCRCLARALKEWSMVATVPLQLWLLRQACLLLSLSSIDQSQCESLFVASLHLVDLIIKTTAQQPSPSTKKAEQKETENIPESGGGNLHSVAEEVRTMVGHVTHSVWQRQLCMRLPNDSI